MANQLKTSDKFLISIDLDGTLVKTLSRGINVINKQIVKKILARNHIVILATGRPFVGSESIYRWMEMQHPVICNSGATIYHKKHNTLALMKVFCFRFEALQQLIKIPQLQNDAVSLMFQNLKGFFVTRINQDLIQFTLVEKFFKFTECSINKLPLKNTYSVAVLFEHDIDMDFVIKQVHAIGDNYFHAFEVRVGKIFDSHNMNKNGFRLLDIIVTKYSKAEAIEYLRQKFCIDSENVIVFGDSDNDISTLTKFHHNSVAMKNASQAVKRAAKHITEFDNNAGGVGLYLKKFFNLL